MAPVITRHPSNRAAPRHGRSGRRAGTPLAWVVFLALTTSLPAALRTESELLMIAADVRVGVTERNRALADLQAVATERSLPMLVAALRDPTVRMSALSVLEAMPGPNVEHALGTALRTAGDDSVCAALIHSLGTRRSAVAVPVLAEFLRPRDSASANAALSALGNIGTAASAKALSIFDPPAPLKVAWSDAVLRVAERLVASDRQQAIELYRRVSAAGEPAQKAAAAVALALHSEDSIGGVIGLLASPEPATRTAALAVVRRGALGSDLIRKLSPAISSLPAEVQVQVLSVLHDRADREAAAIARRSLQSEDPAVQAAAAKLLSVLGTAADAPALSAMMDGPGEPAKSARLALARIPGDEVTLQLIERFRAGNDGRASALEVLVARGHRAILPALLRPELHADEALRPEIAGAIGTLATAADLEAVLGLHGTLPRDQRAPLETAVRRIAAKDSSPDAATALIVVAADKLPVAESESLYNMLPAVGGDRAFQALVALAGSAQPELRRRGMGALGGWRDIRAADTLLSSAKKETEPALRALAVRSATSVLARSAQGEGNTPMKALLPRVIAGLRQAWDLAERPADRTAILNALRGLKVPEAREAADELRKSDRAP